MKTLVIHPKDISTDFLSIIYQNKDYTILNDGRISKKQLKLEIKKHDRIIMLGHGDENGLIDLNIGRYIINSTLIYLLKEKDIVAIWCNADKFVEKYKLKGFYSGMFISEIEETYNYISNASSISIDEIEISNKLFAKTVNKFIEDDDILEKVKQEYMDVSSCIINFNNDKLYKS